MSVSESELGSTLQDYSKRGARFILIGGGGCSVSGDKTQVPVQQ